MKRPKIHEGNYPGVSKTKDTNSLITLWKCSVYCKDILLWEKVRLILSHLKHQVSSV